MIRNIIAVIVGILLGGAVNMAIIMASSFVIPPPAGADLTTQQGLVASMHLMQPKHFIMPFLAHALGTFAGAFLAAKIASSRKLNFAMVIGIVFLIGGIANVIMLPSPLWFTVLDLAGAYIPVAYLGYKSAA